jgi:hypothetical protein
MAEPGHLFVVRGDLTRIHADAHLIPCDGGANVSDFWSGFLADEDLVTSREPQRLRVKRFDDVEDGLPVPLSAGRWLMATVSDQPHDLARIVAAAVARVATDPSVTTNRLHRLVALPVPGTGQGGLAHDRGGVIKALLPALRDAATRTGADIALVVDDDRDEAAAQAIRADRTYWDALPATLDPSASDLGARAATDAIALFLGAGISRPLNLPDWRAFLDDLADRAPIPVRRPRTSDSLPAYATRIAQAYGRANLDDEIVARFRTSTYALGHGLLASLRLTAAVTTNYDAGYETAVRGITREYDDGPISVLAQMPVNPPKPWVLKLHGDAASGRGLVLTSGQYRRHLSEAHALRGLVQGLMITNHLVFVGYSLADSSFVDLAAKVADALSGSDTKRRYGTVLALAPDRELRDRCGQDLEPIEMADSGPDIGARILEIFLDRAAWAAVHARSDASSYLLDDRYANARFTDEERALQAVLRSAAAELARIESSRETQAVESHALRETRKLLRSLGAP